jgi:hypothetical protein
MNKTRAPGKHMALSAGSNFAFKAVLGTLYVNPDAIVERRDDPAISGKTDTLDIAPFAHLHRCPLGVAPLGRHRAQRYFASLGCHVCREHFC